MKRSRDIKGFNLIEFLLSIVALFLFFIITSPIVIELIQQSHKAQIKDNLVQIRKCTNQYFEKNPENSVSLYEFVGPRKVISELEIIADEKYPKIIFRGEEISAYSEKYGTIKVQQEVLIK